MRDLHSHFLPNVDDGSRSMEMTEDMLKNAYDNNVTDIVFTPHYILDTKYNKTYKENLLVFEQVKKIADRYHINIYLGNEVFLNNDIVELYNKNIITTINNSKYMLIEIPLLGKINNIKSIMFELMNIGIVPILAHPERYSSYYNDLSFFEELRNMGVLLQINLTSINGKYGFRAKRMVKKLLKKDLISFCGSDIHRSNSDIYDTSLKAIKKIKRIVGSEKMQDIVNNNFLKVVNNENI